MSDGAAADALRERLARAIERRVFPAACAEVGTSGGPIWRQALGTLTFDDGAPHASETTVFDLASLTKPVATTTLTLELLAEERLRLDEPVSAIFEEWRGIDREPVTVRDLLEHASGLAARLLDPPPTVRREFEHEICGMPLEYAPRSRSLYSDLGFILLGFLLEERGQDALSAQFDRVTRPLLAVDTTGVLAFGVPSDALSQTAPTEPLDDDVRRGRRLAGEVHDNYAAALGGVAGHAGLFGTAGGLGRFAQLVLRAARGDGSGPPPFTPALLSLATTKSTVPGSSRALGWDTMLPTSSCGTAMSPAAFGHVGFTGTSLWIDPGLDRYFVLLTNRACGGGTVDEMRDVRREFHDTAVSLRF